MIRRLGILVMVAGAALLAGCASSGGNTPESSFRKHKCLMNLSAPEHDCDSYWGAKASALLTALQNENSQQGPVGGLQPLNRGWANRTDTPQGAAIRDALLNLYRTLAEGMKTVGANLNPPDPPHHPPQGVTPQQMDIGVLAIDVETLFNADHHSGFHEVPPDQPWLVRPPPPPPPGVPPPYLPDELLRAIKDALDM